VIPFIPVGQLKEFLAFLTIPFIGLNFVDIAIILIIAVYAFEGYSLGFVRATADFITFIISFAFGLLFYESISSLLTNNFEIPIGIGNALGFFIAAFVSEFFLILAFRHFIYPQISKITKNRRYPKEAGHIGGIFPGILSAVVLIAFVLTMIIALPFSPFLNSAVSESKLGEPLVSNIQGLDKDLNAIFGRALNDALTFLTIEPASSEFLKLNFQVENIKIDEDSEKGMTQLINLEREKENLPPLTGDQTLRSVARKHCIDMLTRGYFSHYTPEGKSPFDRMAEDDILFESAGENLALAPNSKLAMQGLMKSPGHRTNILSQDFGTIGIGVIDGGIYGRMFCQEFTD